MTNEQITLESNILLFIELLLHHANNYFAKRLVQNCYADGPF